MPGSLASCILTTFRGLTDLVRLSVRVNRADFVYMAPPFIAYYGALQGGAEGTKLLQLAYDQCRLYRDVLFDADKSLWRHIELGSSSDDHLWGTGASSSLFIFVLALLRRLTGENSKTCR